MRIFIPITKVDQQKREVWGRMTQQVEDSAGETIDYDGSKPYFEEWSSKFSKATDGKSLGNVRAMHQPISAGKVIRMDFLDDDQAIDIGTKIVDDKEWEKVEEGIYTGFSIGGEYVKRWTEGTKKFYIAKIKEVSLVDSPAVPTAMFSMIKADGSIEKRSFKMQTQTQTAAVDVLAEMLNKSEITPERLIELAKADIAAKPAVAVVEIPGAEAKKAAEAETKPAAVEPAVAKTDTPAMAAAAAVAEKTDAQRVQEHNERIALKARELCKAAHGGKDDQWQGFVADAIRELKKAESQPVTAPAKDTAPAPVAEPKPATEVTKTETTGELKKGLYNCQSLADILMSLAYCASSAQSEADWEGDQSGVPAQLREAAKAVGQALKDMTAEEVDELIESMGGMGGSMMYMADRVTDLVKSGKLTAAHLEKYGARHSKTDLDRVQGIHKAIVELGAKCDKDDDSDMSAADKGGQLKKALGALSKVDELEKTVTALQTELTDTKARLKKVEDMPLPPKGATRVVGKDDENKDPAAAQKEIQSTPGQHNPAAAEALIKQQVVATAGARKF